MQNKIKLCWKGLNSKEQSAFVVFGSFILGVFILAIGVKIGQIVAQIANML